MKILLTGATGQVGGELLRTLAGEVVAPGRGEMDLADAAGDFRFIRPPVESPNDPLRVLRSSNSRRGSNIHWNARKARHEINRLEILFEGSQTTGVAATLLQRIGRRRE